MSREKNRPDIPANLKRSTDELIHSGSEFAKKTTALDYDISLHE
ncbi:MULTISPECIES: hypothetical protein [unclassified Methanohalophilus]|nr:MULTISPECIES: hypothetical protein [unclassified Methanohalophilus]